MLLTQSQVSFIFTSAIVLVATLLLFLSGYFYQQKTVRELGATIRPIIPKSPPSIQPQLEQQTELLRSRFFNENAQRIVYADLNADIHGANVKVDWTRLAHVQLVQRHHDVCNAIMILADFHRLRSPAKRVLLFPREWADERAAFRGDVSDPFLDSTRRLLRRAARRYHIELRPIEPFGDSVDGTWAANQYSLASAFALSDYDRVLTLEAPGVLMAAEPLDAILAFTEPAPLAMLHDTHANDSVHSQDLYLIQPSEETFATASAALLSTFRPTGELPDSTLSSLLSSSQSILLAPTSVDHALVRAIAALHDVESGFNQTEFLTNVAYMRFSDPKLPGPEYEVPWEMKRAARPKNRDADWTWTKLYTEFAQKRVEVCGLDLEAWRE